MPRHVIYASLKHFFEIQALNRYTEGVQEIREKIQQHFYPCFKVYSFIPQNKMIIVKFLCMKLIILMQSFLHDGCFSNGRVVDAGQLLFIFLKDTIIYLILDYKRLSRYCIWCYIWATGWEKGTLWQILKIWKSCLFHKFYQCRTISENSNDLS